MTDLAYPELGLSELLDNLCSNAVYALRAPDGATGDFIIYQRIDRNDFGKNILNKQAGDAGQVQAVIQIDAYSETYHGAKLLAAKIEKTLDGYKGAVQYGTNSPRDSVTILGITLQNDVDILDQTDDPLLFRVSGVYLVTYQQ